MPFRLSGRDAELGQPGCLSLGTYAYIPLMGVESMGYVNTKKTTWIWNVLRAGEAVNS